MQPGREGYYPETAREKIKKILPVILVAAIMTYILVRLGILGTLQNTGMDHYLKLRSTSNPEQIVIVQITENDYATLFQSQSPLEASQFQKLLNAIISGNPRIIGIDINTAAPQFQSIYIPQNAPPIVWGVDAPNHGEIVFPQSILGGRGNHLLKGVTLLPKDSDEIVRTYQRQFRMKDGVIPSLPWEIIRNVKKESSREDGEFILDFPVNIDHFTRPSATSVLGAAKGKAWSSGILKDKIVLLGGAYGASPDRYKTPVGEMLGVEIIAEIIQSELEGSVARKPNEFALVSLEIFGGVIILLIFLKFYFPFSAIISGLSIPVLAIISSYLGYDSMSKWYCFVPTPIIATVYGSYNELKRYEKPRILLGLLLSPRKTLGDMITRTHQSEDHP